MSFGFRLTAPGRVSAGLCGLAALLLAGCETPPPSPERVAAYEQYVGRWIQDSEANLVASWGIPDSSHAMETGGRVIEYRALMEEDVVCITRFTIDSFGRVQKSWYRGSRCATPEGV